MLVPLPSLKKLKKASFYGYWSLILVTGDDCTNNFSWTLWCTHKNRGKKCNGCMALPFLMPQKNSKARWAVVSFAAVIRVVTRHATLLPTGEERCVTSTPWNSWRGCATRFSKSWPFFRPKQCHFSHPFSDMASKFHTHSQTWPLRNYVIIT